MSFETFKPYKDLVDEQLDLTFGKIFYELSLFDNPKVSDRLKNSYHIAKSFMLNGGKRLRPILLLLVAQAFGMELETDLVRESLSVEFVHNSTLAHDDIIDGDSWRRGDKTVHEKCKELYPPNVKPYPNFTDANTAKGVSEAIIIGNILFSQGCFLLNGFSSDQNSLSVDALIYCYTKINRGQILDNQPIDNLEDYLTMAQLKTAELFACSARIGAYLAGQDKNIANRIHEMVLPAGLAFQITDDLLDLDPIREDKQGSDIKKAKSNIIYCSFNKLAKSKQKQEFDSYFGKNDLTKRELARAIQLLKNSGAIDEVKEIRDKMYEESLKKNAGFGFSLESENLLMSFLRLLAIRGI